MQRLFSGLVSSVPFMPFIPSMPFMPKQVMTCCMYGFDTGLIRGWSRFDTGLVCYRLLSAVRHRLEDIVLRYDVHVLVHIAYQQRLVVFVEQ